VIARGSRDNRPRPRHPGSRRPGSRHLHAVLGAADALGEPLAALLGDPAYHRRFGFELSTVYQITPPRPHWQPHFQVRVLSAYHPRLRGTFTYPEPFDRT
jgi:putative acetyltransferase